MTARAARTPAARYPRGTDIGPRGSDDDTGVEHNGKRGEELRQRHLTRTPGKDNGARRGGARRAQGIERAEAENAQGTAKCHPGHARRELGRR